MAGRERDETVSKLRTYWGRLHPELSTGAPLETEAYARRWSKLEPLHASSEREAREAMAARLSNWGHPMQRAQVFAPGGVGGLGLLTWDGPVSALVRPLAPTREGGAR